MHIIIGNYICMQTCKHDMRSQPERCISMQAKDRLRGLHLSPRGGARLLLRHAMESQGPAPWFRAMGGMVMGNKVGSTLSPWKP